MPPLTCPSCQQQNADNMAFCIFCGSSLKPGNPSGRQPRIVGGTCSKCNKSDSLNNQFCIFCGSSMVPKASEKEAPVAVVEPIKPVAPPKPAVNKRALASLVGIVGGVLLGAGAGAGIAFVLPKAPPPLALPDAQLVLVTAKPAAQVVLSNEQSFFIGKTGDDGNFTADGLPAGKYDLVLGDTRPQPVAIEEQKQTVLGAPPGPKLLSNE